MTQYKRVFNFLPDLIERIRKLDTSCKMYLFYIPLTDDCWVLKDRNDYFKGNPIFSGHYTDVYNYLYLRLQSLKQLNKV